MILQTFILNPMRKKFTILLFLICKMSYGQNIFKTTLQSPQGPVEFLGDATGKKIKCEITPLMNQQIENEIARNQAVLIQSGILSPVHSVLPVRFAFPLRKKAGLLDPGVYHIGNYIDHDPSTSVQDYNCGTRTYDGHNGTDIGISPFEWYKMDNNHVEVISAAAGVIVNKSDGNFDRNCSWNNTNWNAVYIQHSDGTVAWYGHLKSGSLTTKAVGQSVVAGEYLGAVGSSGMSSGPHLHFELRSSTNAVLDPWSGSCNSSASLWLNQEPYYKSGLNKIMTASSVPSTQCSSDTLHPSSTFCPGGLIYLVSGYRDQQDGQAVVHEIISPVNVVEIQWTQSFSGYGDHSWYVWGRFLPWNAQPGNWKYRITYLGNVYESAFTVLAPVAASVSIAASTGTNICAGNSVTFTAIPVNGGNAPIYKWKRNGTIYGGNSPTYTTSSLTNGTVVTCTMISNSTAQCFTGNDTVISNSLNMSVTSVSTPTVTITQSPSGAISPTATVTFTAAVTNGGTPPGYQWMKNNLPVGTNSSTYVGNTWVKGDVIKCIMTSTKPCVNSNPATSNSITISTLPKYLTVDVVTNKAYYYDANFTYLVNHTMSSTVLNGTTNASDVQAVGTKAYVLDQVNKKNFQKFSLRNHPGSFEDI